MEPDKQSDPVSPETNIDQQLTSPQTDTTEQSFNEDNFTQPFDVETNEQPTEPTVTTDTNLFGPAHIDTQNDISPALSSDAPFSPVTEAVAPVQVAAVQVSVAPAKKSLLWLWITLGVVFVIIGGLLTGYFVVKSAADTEAKNYSVSLDTYLDDVYDAATTAQDDPSDVVKEIEAIAPPKLDEVLLGSLSNEYVNAEKTESTSKTEVDSLLTKIKEYSAAFTLAAEYKRIDTEIGNINETLTANSTEAEFLNATDDVFELLKEQKTLFNDAILSDDLADTLKKLTTAIDDEVTAWQDLIDAVEEDNETAYYAAYDDFTAADKIALEMIGEIKTYNNSVSKKINDAAGQLRDYSDTL